jgi:hypothetical protein
MRIRYFYTSDLDKIPKRIRYHLKSCFEENNVYGDFQNLIGNTEEEVFNPIEMQKNIENIRQRMIKLDTLLEETSQLLTACQEAALQRVNQEGND